MGILTYGMHVSLDGYIEDPAGSIDFSAPDEEVHRVANRQAKNTSAYLLGRGLYEMMEEFWTDPERADGGEVEAEFARAYTDTPRIVFSDTLDSVPDGCRLVRSADAARRSPAPQVGDRRHAERRRRPLGGVVDGLDRRDRAVRRADHGGRRQVVLCTRSAPRSDVGRAPGLPCFWMDVSALQRLSLMLARAHQVH